ncbi:MULTISPECIES: helix-turn-helix domain-containing protein [Novosphingobium]|uniref:helix-turn-helix domain-containing protein n=1 Tax=Novosphingobium TaxID=165696 RepID=UPI001CD1E8D6|nr:helix-turn-helix transcriptional regulator [Novosphingobium percolationis]
MLNVPNRNFVLDHGIDTTAMRPPQGLSDREAGVLRCLAWGFSSKETGDVLGISRRTVECHRASVLRKLQARNGPDAVRIALATGIALDAPDTDIAPQGGED